MTEKKREVAAGTEVLTEVANKLDRNLDQLLRVEDMLFRLELSRAKKKERIEILNRRMEKAGKEIRESGKLGLEAFKSVL